MGADHQIPHFLHPAYATLILRSTNKSPIQVQKKDDDELVIIKHYGYISTIMDVNMKMRIITQML